MVGENSGREQSLPACRTSVAAQLKCRSLSDLSVRVSTLRLQPAFPFPSYPKEPWTPVSRNHATIFCRPPSTCFTHSSKDASSMNPYLTSLSPSLRCHIQPFVKTHHSRLTSLSPLSTLMSQVPEAQSRDWHIRASPSKNKFCNYFTKIFHTYRSIYMST